MTGKLTPAELAELDAAVAEVSPDREELGFAHLLDQFHSLVTNLPEYAFSIYDYDNDLGARVLIDQALDRCPPVLRAKVEGALRELDAAFFAQTSKTIRHFGGDCPGCSHNWFEWLPKEPGQELRRDIEGGNI